jgi:hypothetical protein
VSAVGKKFMGYWKVLHTLPGVFASHFKIWILALYVTTIQKAWIFGVFLSKKRLPWTSGERIRNADDSTNTIHGKWIRKAKKLEENKPAGAPYTYPPARCVTLDGYPSGFQRKLMCFASSNEKKWRSQVRYRTEIDPICCTKSFKRFSLCQLSPQDPRHSAKLFPCVSPAKSTPRRAECVSYTFCGSCDRDVISRRCMTRNANTSKRGPYFGRIRWHKTWARHHVLTPKTRPNVPSNGEMEKVSKIYGAKEVVVLVVPRRVGFRILMLKIGKF